jgi:hypothetical protein
MFIYPCALLSDSWLSTVYEVIVKVNVTGNVGKSFTYSLINNSLILVPPKDKIDVPAKDKVDVPANGKIDVPAKDKVDVPAKDMVDVPAQGTDKTDLPAIGAVVQESEKSPKYVVPGWGECLVFSLIFLFMIFCFYCSFHQK